MATPLSTFTLVNTSSTATAAGAVTQLIGYPFKKGDIPSGSWPRFAITNTNQGVPCTLLSELAARWSDGSLKFVPAMLSVPVQVPGSGSVAIAIYNDGTLPTTTRSLADLTNGVDIQVQADGQWNLSTGWTADLGQAISAGTQIVQYGNGAAGAVWRIRANFRKNGADHGQLVCDFYVAALSNSDGSLKGLRILGKLKLPYYDVSTNGDGGSSVQPWMAFSSLKLMDGSTLLRDCLLNQDADGNYYFGPGNNAPMTFSCTGATNQFRANNHYSPEHGNDKGYCVFLEGSSLPGGLQAGVPYWLDVVTASEMNGAISLSTSSSGSITNGHLVSATSSGSGTAIPYPALAYYGALFTCGNTAMPDWLRGAGTDASDTTLIAQIDQHYWIATQVLPPYNLSLLGTIESNYQTLTNPNQHAWYWCNCGGPVTRSLGTTGERDDLGIVHAWGARHFYTQQSFDLQLVNVVSLVGMQMSVGVESSATKTYPCINNSNYTDLPNPFPRFTWNPNENPTVLPPPAIDYTDQSVQCLGFNNQNYGHMPAFCYYAYMMTGAPWHYDGVLEFGLYAVMSRKISGQGNYDTAVITSSNYYTDSNAGGGCRNIQVPATPSNPVRYGCTVGGANIDGERADAWSIRDLGVAAGIAASGTDYLWFPSYLRMLNDMWADTWNLALDIHRAQGAAGSAGPQLYAYNVGMWEINQSGQTFAEEPWQRAYLIGAGLLGANLTESANAFSALQLRVGWYDHAVTTWTGWHVGTEQNVGKNSALNPGAAPVAGDSYVAFQGPTVNWNTSGFNWASYANGFVMLPPGSPFPASNNDVIVWEPSEGAQARSMPGGLKQAVPYYVVNFDQLSGAFSLSESPGGTAVAPTDSGSSAHVMIVASHPPSFGTMTASGSSTSYITMILGACNDAKASGLTVANTTITDFQGRCVGVDFSGNPKWALTNSFNQ